MNYLLLSPPSYRKFVDFFCAKSKKPLHTQWKLAVIYTEFIFGDFFFYSPSIFPGGNQEIFYCHDLKKEITLYKCMPQRFVCCWCALHADLKLRTIALFVLHCGRAQAMPAAATVVMVKWGVPIWCRRCRRRRLRTRNARSQGTLETEPISSSYVSSAWKYYTSRTQFLRFAFLSLLASA